jgi:hypothetical protein
MTIAGFVSKFSEVDGRAVWPSKIRSAAKLSPPLNVISLANFRAMSFTVQKYQQKENALRRLGHGGRVRSGRFNFFIELFDNTLRRVATP